MTDINMKILKLIDDGLSLNEISTHMKLSNKQIHQRIMDIKNSGYLLERKIFTDGNIKYSKALKLLVTEEHSLKLNLTDNKTRIMIISDLHIGNGLENLSYLDLIYNHCITNNIHTIINAGDIIDGPSSFGEQKTSNPEEQINTLIKYYPFDKNILNLICLGNHDFNAVSRYSIDPKRAISSSRSDLIPVGYNISIINIGRDQIIVKHPIRSSNFNNIKGPITLLGHQHKFACINKPNEALIYVPTLSDLTFHYKQYLPGALTLELYFNEKNLIRDANLEQFIILNNQLLSVGEHTFYFNNERTHIYENDVLPLVKKLKKTI